MPAETGEAIEEAELEEIADAEVDEGAEVGRGEVIAMKREYLSDRNLHCIAMINVLLHHL